MWDALSVERMGLSQLLLAPIIHVYNIAAWNANRLTQRIKEVEVNLNTQKIDILLMFETHFTEQNYVNIPNYVTYATNHPYGRAHAG
jgi:exonuclease III